ncbi:MAG: hypothetical protein JNK72_21155 [Myxococcales bacterium]|nr:hypothetical protein [Myxococcales bacterium]
MAEVSIRFRHNPKTGQRELVIVYESERDALPHEHERDHRALAEALLGQTLGDDVSHIRVERVGKDGRTLETRDEPVGPGRTPVAQGR